MARKITNDEFLIQVKADIDQAVAELKKFTGEVNKTGDAGEKSSRGLNAASGNMRTLVAAAGAYLTLGLAKRLLLEADRWNQLQARIRTATRATGDYNEVSRELFRVSQANGQQLATSVSLFQNLARTAPELGATNQQMLQLTNTVQQLGVISGTTLAQQRAGLLQFTQGLAGGVFRAEEFNSIIENLPELASRIAQGMGLTVGQLRQAVIDGKVLSQDVFDAIQGQAVEINEQFGDMPDSIERAATAAGNSFSNLLSTLDKAVDGTGTIATLLRTAAESMDNISERLEETPLAKAERERAKLAREFSEIIAEGTDRESPAARRLIVQIDALDEVIKDLQPKVDELLDSGEDGKVEIIDPEELERIKAYEKRLAKLLDTLNPTAKEMREFHQAVEDLKTALDKGDISQQQFDAGIVSLASNLSVAQAETNRLADEQEKLAAKEKEAAEQAEKEAIAAQKLIDRLIPAAAATRDLQRDLDLLNQLFFDGQISGDVYDEATESLLTGKDATKDLGDSGVEQFKRLEAAARGWGDQTAAVMADMVTGGEASFRQLADTIIKELLRIMIFQNLVTPLFTSMGIPGFGASASVPTNHSGGLAGSGARRQVSPALFLSAQRYHGGGIAGLRPNEVPTILEAGEEVLTRKDPRHRANQSGGNIAINVTNKNTPIQVESSSASFDGDRLVLNVVTSDLKHGGPFSRQLESTFGMRRK